MKWLHSASIIAAVVIVKLVPLGLMRGILRMHIRNPVIVAHPLISVIICPHAVVQHASPGLDELSEMSAGSEVLGIPVHMTHEQDNAFAEDGALDGCASVVQQIALVLLYCLVDAILQNLFRSSVLETECTLYHLGGVLHFAGSEAVAVAGLGGDTMRRFRGSSQRRSFTLAQPLSSRLHRLSDVERLAPSA